jgi:hypothetical protein
MAAWHPPRWFAVRPKSRCRSEWRPKISDNLTGPVNARNGRSGSMPLKKSVAKGGYATIESRRPAVRINVARTIGFFESKCAAARSKSFFNTIGHQRRINAVRDESASPSIVPELVHRSEPAKDMMPWPLRWLLQGTVCAVIGVFRTKFSDLLCLRHPHVVRAAAKKRRRTEVSAPQIGSPGAIGRHDSFQFDSRINLTVERWFVSRVPPVSVLCTGARCLRGMPQHGDNPWFVHL